MSAAFLIKRNDTSPIFRATCSRLNQTTNQYEAVSLVGASARFKMRKNGTTKVDAAATVADAANGIVTYAWQAADTNEAGHYEAEVEVTFSDSTIETFPNNGFSRVNISEDI